MIDRRHFLTSLLGLGTSALAAGQQAALSYKGENLQYGLVTYMWGAAWDLPTLLANCQQADVFGVELRVQHAHQVEPGMSQQKREEVRRQFADSPVKVLGMGTNAEFHSPEAGQIQKNLAVAKDYLKLSHDIGGSGVKVKPNALPAEVPVGKTLEQIGKCLAELGEYADGLGQEIRLEVHGGVCDLGHIRTIMEVADRENVRVCWNSNDEDLRGKGLAANFAKVKPYLGHTVHIREVNDGSYPYAELARLLVECDYAGWVLLEARSKPADRVAAQAEQKRLFMNMVTAARKAAA